MIDWIEVEELMAKSVRAHTLSDEEQALMERAFMSDRLRYRDLHQQVLMDVDWEIPKP